LPGATLDVYWAPQGAFALVDSAKNIPYGAANLVARLSYAGLKRGAQVTAVWRGPGGPQPLLSQNLTAQADGATLQAIASMPIGQAFAAGEYQVVVTVIGAGQMTARFTVQPAAALADRQPADVYSAALTPLGEAIEAIGAGRLAEAESAARRAAPDLRTALAAAPQLPDLLCALELDQAIIALAELARAAAANQRAQAVAWAERTVAHARYVADHATEAVFRQAGRELADQVGATLPKLRQGG